MSPFREPPVVELGPLSVGLGRAAQRAMAGMIPSGGRLLVSRQRDAVMRRVSPAAGAVGSFGLVTVAVILLTMPSRAWHPQDLAGTSFFFMLVIAAGVSLATMIRAVDTPQHQVTLQGVHVARACIAVLRQLQRLASHAERAPERFGHHRIASLRQALTMLTDPLIADWIPNDVRGRAELLLARAVAAGAGSRWTRDVKVRAEVETLLLSAHGHLAEPEAARSDMMILEGLGSVHEPASAEERRDEAAVLEASEHPSIHATVQR